jgi:parallel beta-helix repeat protein
MYMGLRRISSFKISLTTSLIFVILVFTSLRFAHSYNSFQIPTSKGEYIQWNFTSIQEAVNEAESGASVYVPSGIYYEHVVINKTISLIGENFSTTIIDGSNAGTVVTITADNVSISGFTIQNSGWGWYKNGIYTYMVDNCEIKNNFLFHNCQNIRLNFSRNSQVLENTINSNGYGIRFINSINCTAIDNTVSNCIGGIHLQNATSCTVRGNYFTQNSQGIRLYSPCTYNNIIANTVYNNSYDGMIEAIPGNTTFFANVFFHNNFINNKNPFIYKVTGNIWDDAYPSGGNYWSRYNETDFFRGSNQNETGSDGIGDTPYYVNRFDVDRYPLMNPWNFRVLNVNTGIGYNTIQGAIDASETLDGHALWVSSGLYYEHVKICKSLALIGENRSTTIIDGNNVDTVLAVDADKVSVTEFTIRNSGLNFPPYNADYGVFLNHSIGSSISHCLITNNRIGIYLFFSKDNIIENNVVSSNHENGIWLWYSGNNFLTENTIANSSYNFGVFGGSFTDFNNTIDISNTVDEKPIQYLVGVEDEIYDNQTDTGALYLINCSNVTVRNLNLSRNGHGVFCYAVTDSLIEHVTCLNNNYGIYLQDSVGNVVGNNNCSSNWVGFCLQDSNHNVVENSNASNCEKGISLYKASNNNLSDNTITNNLYGIRLYSSHYNRIFHNNLTENAEQVSLINSNQNVWDNGYPSGGNYWSDYNGIDFYSGPYQNVTGSDGIGDTPYIIDANNLDHYPQVRATGAGGFDWWPRVIIIVVVLGVVTATALVLLMRKHSTHGKAGKMEHSI